MDIRDITITTLSPVHIGCDEDFVPTNFVIKNNLLHYLDMGVVADTLDASERTALGQKQTISAIQSFFKSKRDRLVPLSTHTVEVASDIAREYDEKAGKAAQPGVRDETIYAQFNLARTAYAATGFTPYLPGSSLKGSIRTAWLDAINNGRPLQQLDISSKDKNQQNRELQQNLLGYSAGSFEDDPLRQLCIADAHHNEGSMAAPTRILYAISKKKKPGPYRPTELNTYLETICELLVDVFAGEIRFMDDKVSWKRLCEACNAFYWPQLESELEHPHLGSMLDREWRQIIRNLLAEEFQALRQNRQGFLLRVGRHSGAESMTLNVMRNNNIKIIGKAGTPSTYRSETTEKRFASQTRNATDGLLPFGWLWVESCQDEFQWISSAIRDKLRPHSESLREAQRDRLQQMEERREARLAAILLEEQRRAREEEIQRRKAEEGQVREAKLAAMSPNFRQIEELRAEMEQRIAANQKLRISDNFYGQAIQPLAHRAAASSNWSAAEKCALADMLQEWATRLVSHDAKDLRKRLKLSVLRGQA